MKASEILRKLADVIDQHSTDGGRPVNSTVHAELAPVEVDNTDNTETTVQIPPLQAKLELLKKSVGVENAYDGYGNTPACCGPTPDEEVDEVAAMKRIAGIQEMSDDEPTEG